MNAVADTDEAVGRCIGALQDSLSDNERARFEAIAAAHGQTPGERLRSILFPPSTREASKRGLRLRVEVGS